MEIFGEVRAGGEYRGSCAAVWVKVGNAIRDLEPSPANQPFTLIKVLTPWIKFEDQIRMQSLFQTVESIIVFAAAIPTKSHNAQRHESGRAELHPVPEPSTLKFSAPARMIIPHLSRFVCFFPAHDGFTNGWVRGSARAGENTSSVPLTSFRPSYLYIAPRDRQPGTISPSHHSYQRTHPIHHTFDLRYFSIGMCSFRFVSCIKCIGSRLEACYPHCVPRPTFLHAIHPAILPQQAI